VDRMSDVVCSEEPAVKNRTILDYDPANMAPVQFGMWGEKLRGVTMVVDKEAVNIVKDKFGDKVTYTPIDGNKCRVHGKVAVGPVFYAWVAMFSNRMKILKPPSVIEGYKDYLRECMEPYEDD